MLDVIKGYNNDAVEVKKLWQQLDPPHSAARDQLLTASAAQAELYAKLRNKLTRVGPDQLWSDETRALMVRASSTNNEGLRQKALQANNKAAQAWAHKCAQELESADRIVAHYSAISWRFGQAHPGHDTELQRAGALLAALQAVRGDGWLAPILEPLGLVSRSGMFGAPPQPSPLGSCPEMTNVVAPLGPAITDTAPLPDGLQLPQATRVVTALGEGQRVYITPLGLYLGSERHLLARLGNDAALVGFGASAKPSINHLSVLPLRAALQVKASNKQVEILLFIDEQTPYRVLLEALYTLGQEGYTRCLFVTRPTSSGQVQGIALNISEPLTHSLTVMVVNLGYVLRWDGQRIGADCGKGPTTGMAVPLLNGKLDPTGLATCVARLLPDEAGIAATIMANPRTPYADFIATAEALVPYAALQLGMMP